MPGVSSRLKKILLIIVLLLAVPLALNALSYINFDPSYNFLRLKKKAIETGWYLPAYYAHVLVASIVLLIGVFQVFPGTRTKWNRMHRLLGKMYVGGILFFSAPGAFLMSLFINRGPWVLFSFLFQCGFWFAFTYFAYESIRKGNVVAHRKWMLRSLALTLAAITLRLYVFVSSWSFDLTQPNAYATIAWLSWVINLVVCELYLIKNPSVIGRPTIS